MVNLRKWLFTHRSIEKPPVVPDVGQLSEQKDP